jgi:hypothetical protein
MLRPVIHLLLHFIVPAATARICFRKIFARAFLIMLATMAVDLDHLLASPVYDPGRCSVGFHPLHQYPFIAAYVVLAAIPKTRLLGIGLLIHMFLDGVDCIWMNYEN